MDISQCVKNLSTTTNNIKKLHDSEFNILQPTLKNPNGSHKNNTYLILLIIPSVLVFLVLESSSDIKIFDCQFFPIKVSSVVISSLSKSATSRPDFNQK